MKTFCFAIVFAVATAAQDASGGRFLRYNGNTSSIPFNDSAFTDATPAVSREVSFDRTLGNRNSPRMFWGWKLSVSELELPNTTAFIAEWDTQPDSRLAYTTFELSWPDGGNVNQAVAAETRPSTNPIESCIYHLWATLPQNVSDAWDPSSSSCSSAIGPECSSYIFNSMGNIPGCAVGNRQSLYDVPACATSFGVATEPLATMSYAFGNISAPANGTAFASGDTMAWTVSDSYAPGNTTAFEMAKNRLYVMIMTNSYGTQVLCNRAGDGLEDDGNAGNGSNTGASPDNSDVADENASGGRAIPDAISLGIATLIAVGISSVL